ncbi:MAG: YegP family protein [Anaerolineales bacterium]
MAGKFTLRKTDKGNFVFNLKASNGQVILTSQPYSDRRSALNGIESVRKNACDDGRIERLTATNGRPYFVVKAANTQVVGTSEMYSAKASLENGIASVVRTAPNAVLEDLTIE